MTINKQINTLKIIDNLLTDDESKANAFLNKLESTFSPDNNNNHNQKFKQEIDRYLRNKKYEEHYQQQEKITKLNNMG